MPILTLQVAKAALALFRLSLDLLLLMLLAAEAAVYQGQEALAAAGLVALAGIQISKGATALQTLAAVAAAAVTE